MKKLLSISIAILLSISAIAGGWLQPKGGGYFKLDHTFIRTQQFFDQSGEIVKLRTLGNYTTSVYGEYGISKNITGIAYVPFLVRNTLNRTEGRQTGRELEAGAINQSFGDMDLALKFGLRQNKPLVMSLSLTLGLPTGQPDHELGLITGDGEFNQMVKLELGRSFNSPLFMGLGVGFNNRTQGFSDEFRYDAEIGYKFFNHSFLAILKIRGIESLQNGETDLSSGGMGLFANNVEYMAFGPELAYIHDDKYGVSFGFAGAAKGQNVLAAPSVSFGAFMKLHPKN